MLSSSCIPGEGDRGTPQGQWPSRDMPVASGQGSAGVGPGPNVKPCLSKASAPGVTSPFQEPERKHSTQKVKQQRRAELSPGCGARKSSVGRSRTAGCFLGAGRGCPVPVPLCPMGMTMGPSCPRGQCLPLKPVSCWHRVLPAGTTVARTLSPLPPRPVPFRLQEVPSTLEG